MDVRAGGWVQTCFVRSPCKPFQRVGVHVQKMWVAPGNPYLLPVFPGVLLHVTKRDSGDGATDVRQAGDLALCSQGHKESSSPSPPFLLLAMLRSGLFR